MKLNSRLILFILKHRLLVTAFILGLTVFFGWKASRVQFDNTIETYFLPHDIQDYRQFLDRFGSDELVVVAFSGATDVFNNPDLDLIDRLTQRMEDLPHVHRLLSLINAQIVYGDSESVNFDPLIEALPLSEEEIATARHRALEDSFIPGTVLSRDGRHTAIVLEVDHITGEFDYKVELLNQVKAILEEESQGMEKTFYLGGGPVLDEAIFRYNQEDQGRYIPIMILIMMGIMFLMFRRFTTVLLPMVVVLISIIWTYGFLVLMGYKINIISTIITPLLMAVSVADSIHIVADYLQEHGRHREARRRDCITATFKHLITPVSMTSITTIIGLLSLVSAALVPVRQFGLVAAFGVLAAYLVTLFFLPVLLTLLPAPKETHKQVIRAGFTTRLLTTLGHWNPRRATIILVLCGLLFIPAMKWVLQVPVGTNSLDYFKPGDPVRNQTQWIDSNLGGSVSLEFMVDGGEPDALKNPDLLRRMDRFQHYLTDIPGITGIFSLVDLVKSLNQAFFEGDSSAYQIPETKTGVSQELLLVRGSDELTSLVTDDFSMARISARVAMNQSQTLSEKLPEIEQKLNEIFGREALVQPTGIVYLMHRMENYLLTTQLRSFGIAFTVILLCMILLLRSVRLGLLAIIPNFLPILFTMALMPFFDIALDVGTVMIAGVALGLVVDDSIHFLSRLKLELQASHTTGQAIEVAMLGTGRPLLFTSVILSFGFAVLTLASFNPVIHFGVLSSIVIFLALVFDLVVLPTIIGFLKPKQLL
jgi:predicted RND superfamily exporter protein